MPYDNFKIMAQVTLAALLVVFMVAPVATAQDWNAVKTPIKENINGLCFVHPDTGFLVTSDGRLARTFDGGRSWDVFDAAVGVSLEDLHFFNSDTGFICGSRGTIKITYDGGYTWTDKSLPDTNCWLFDIEMLDRQTGLATGMTRTKDAPLGGLAVRSTDGGKTWTTLKPMGLGYSEILYQPGGTLFFLSYGKLNYSNDKGKSWQSTPLPGEKPGRAISLRGNTAIIGGIEGMSLYSLDRARTWSLSQQDKTTMLIAVQLVNDTVAYMGGTNNTLLRTTDAGRTWNPEPMPVSFNVFDLVLIGDKLYAAGSSSGLMWKQVR